MRKVNLLVVVDAPEDMTDEVVAKHVDNLLNSGWYDASQTAEMEDEDQIEDAKDCLRLTIHSPRLDSQFDN